MTQIAKSEMGQLRANSLADKNNNLQFVECDTCPPGMVCQDTVTGPLTDGNTMVSVTWEGEVIDFSYIPVLDDTDAGTIRAFTDAVTVALCNLISTDYTDERRPYLYGDQPKEVLPGITVTWAADVLTIVHIGEGTLSAMATGDGAGAGLRDCSWASTCVTFLQGVDTLGDLSLNGGPGFPLANDPYAHTGVEVTDDATAVQLETDLGAAIAAAGGTVYAISVTNNIADAAYDMYVRVDFGTTLVLAMAGPFVDQGCDEYAYTP